MPTIPVAVCIRAEFPAGRHPSSTAVRVPSATVRPIGTMRPVADVHELTQAAYDRLKAEYDDLTTRGKIDIARRIEAARELGDLKENGDYHAAKEEQGKMAARIAQIDAMIGEGKYRIVEIARDVSAVQVGCVVTIRYEGDTDVERYLVGSIEERGDLPVLSPGSPLGSQLLGAAVGDTVAFEAPGGTLRVDVVAIEPAD